MTGKADKSSKLTPVATKFVLHWGELGTRWGINRTVAQVHALLYLSQNALDVQSISDVLGVARSNASNSVRELEGWGLVRSVHLMGERREHYEAIADVWQMLSIIAEVRKRREIDPTLTILRECTAELGTPVNVADRFVSARVKNMLHLFETLDPLINEFVSLPSAVIKTMATLRGKVRTLFKTT